MQPATYVLRISVVNNGYLLEITDGLNELGDLLDVQVHASNIPLGRAVEAFFNDRRPPSVKPALVEKVEKRFTLAPDSDEGNGTVKEWGVSGLAPDDY